MPTDRVLGETKEKNAFFFFEKTFYKEEAFDLDSFKLEVGTEFSYK